MKKKSPPKKKVKVQLHKRLPKKLDDDAYAYNTMVIEDLKSTFRVVIEQQSELGGKVDALTHDVAIIKEDLREVKTSQDIMRADISKSNAGQSRMERDIQEIKQELKSIRSEMAEFRTLLSQKTDIERFNRLEERVARIEQELQQRQ